MGGYTNTTIRDPQGNIIGYSPVTASSPYVSGGIVSNGSPEYQQLNNAYAYQQNNIAGSYGAYQQGQIQQYDPSGFTPATGRAAISQANQGVIQQSIYANQNPSQPFQSTVPIRDLSSNAPTRIENMQYSPYELQALQEVQQRPGFTSLDDLGDSRTQAVLKANMAMSQLGFNMPSQEVMAGRTLEAQRVAAAQTPGFSDDRYYGNELQKFIQRPVETSAAYHSMGMKSGVPIPANRFEYQGDLAVELLKGAPQKTSEWFSPVSGEMTPYLPGAGLGVQQYEWNAAMGRKEQVSFTPALEKLASASGQYGPYGILTGARTEGTSVKTESKVLGSGPRVTATPADTLFTPTDTLFSGTQPVGKTWDRYTGGFVNAPPATPIQTPMSVTPASVGSGGGATTTFEPSKGDIFGYQVPVASPVLAFFSPGKSITTTESSKILPEVTTLKGTEVTPIAGGFLTTNTYETTGGKEITQTIATKETPSGFDLFEQGIRDKIPPPAEGERAVQYASLANPFTMPYAVSSLLTEKFNPSQTKNAQTIESLVGMRGQYTTFYEHPTGTVINYGIGAAFGTGAKAIEGVYSVGKVATAEKVISEGGLWRSADMFSGTVMNYAPKALGVLYAADVASRSTQGFTNFEPSSVAPKSKGIVMQEAVPMGMGFALPGQTIAAARTSDIGYKSALQEGATTGRADYYVKQPVSKPFELAKQDYLSYKQEGGTGKVDYILEKTGLNKAPTAPEISRPTIQPEMEFKTGDVYGKQPTFSDYVTKKINAPVAPEVSRNYIEPIGNEKIAYGKQPTIFDSISKQFNKPYAPEVSRNYFETSGNKYPEASEPFGIKVKSYFQEHPLPISESARATSFFKAFRPEGEISRMNAISDFKMQQGNVGGGFSGGGTQGMVTPFGGLPPARSGTKIVGGKPVSGLSREPSLKSMGVKESTGTTASPFKETLSRRSVDFRGQQSQAMKPMRDIKQASGVAILREPLPMIEGMTGNAPMKGNQQISFFTPMSRQRSATSVEAEFDVVQTQRTRREVLFSPQFQTESVFGVSQARSQTTSVLQQSRQRSAVSQMSDVTSTTIQGTRRSTQQERAISFERIAGRMMEPAIDRASRYDTSSRIDQSVRTTPIFETTPWSDVTTTPRTTTTTIPRITTIFDPIKTPIPPKLPGGFLFPGGGSDQSPRPRKDFRKFRESISLRSQLWR